MKLSAAMLLLLQHFQKVRSALLDLQRNIADNKLGLVADGRDMGTGIFPHAHAKIYLTASAQARAKRRVTQLTQAGKQANFDDILADIIARDERDENRSVAPSRPADDALLIDSSDKLQLIWFLKKQCSL